MEINRFNYEEYFILYIDNELDEAERAEVEAFAALHPDLATELDMLKDTIQRPEKKLVFEDKASLLKSEAKQGIVHIDNYEEYFVLYADDELTVDERRQVQEFVYKHPELQGELEAFEAVRMVPEVITFPGKEKLYRRERKPATIGWWKYAAAASVLLIAGALWINNKPGQSGSQSLAEAKTQPKTDRPTTQGPAKTNDLVRGGKENTTFDPIEKMTEEKQANTNFERKENSKHRPERIQSAIQQRLKNTTNEPITAPPAIEEPEAALVRNPQMTVDHNAAFVHAASPTETETVKTMETLYRRTEDRIAEGKSSTVYIASIPVDNPSLKPLLRKASNLVSRVAAIKRGEHRSLSFKNVEIAIQ